MSSKKLLAVFLALQFIGAQVALSQSKAAILDDKLGANSFFNAETLWREGRPILAKRQWRKVVQDQKSPVFLTDIAKKRLSSSTLNNSNYLSSLSYYPRSNRRYSNDTFNLTVNGVDLPFTVNREEDVFDKLTFYQKLQIPAPIKNFAHSLELLTLAHTARLKSNNSLENTFTSTVYIANPSLRHLTSWSKTLTFDENPSSHSTQDKLKLEYVGVNLLSSADVSYFRPLNVSAIQKRSSEYLKLVATSTKAFNKQNVRLSMARQLYRESRQNFTTIKLSSSRKVPSVNAQLSAAINLRFDDSPSFPFSSKRTDQLLKLTASKQVPSVKLISSINISYSTNFSNIDIYDYNEMSMGISFDF